MAQLYFQILYFQNQNLYKQGQAKVVHSSFNAHSNEFDFNLQNETENVPNILFCKNLVKCGILNKPVDYVLVCYLFHSCIIKLEKNQGVKNSTLVTHKCCYPTPDWHPIICLVPHHPMSGTPPVSGTTSLSRTPSHVRNPIPCQEPHSLSGTPSLCQKPHPHVRTPLIVRNPIPMSGTPFPCQKPPSPYQEPHFFSGTPSHIWNPIPISATPSPC